MTKHCVVGGLVLLVAFGTALAGGRQATYRTPQEAFDAAKKAIEREDWKGFCATLTDDSRDTLAGGMLMMPLMLKGFAKLAPEDKQKEILAKLKPLEEVMAKHGLTEEALAAFVNDNAPYYLVPRYVEFVDELPHTPTGRVQKYLLRQRGVTPATWDRVAAGFEVRR